MAVVCRRGLGTLPHPRTRENRGTYPGAGSRQDLPKGLKLHHLVMAHEVSQGAVAAGVSRDQVAPVLLLVDDKVPTAVTAPTTQASVAVGGPACPPAQPCSGCSSLTGPEAP